MFLGEGEEFPAVFVFEGQLFCQFRRPPFGFDEPPPDSQITEQNGLGLRLYMRGAGSGISAKSKGTLDLRWVRRGDLAGMYDALVPRKFHVVEGKPQLKPEGS